MFIGFLFIVILSLIIVQMAGGTKPRMIYRLEPPLGAPPAEVEALIDALPNEWVTYAATMPPLRLHLRGADAGRARIRRASHGGGAGETDEAGNLLPAHNSGCKPAGFRRR
jgi:hypothetical protein